MSILIKGMEMPRNEELIIICSDGTVELTNNDGSRICEQKAVELPPHGRLVDIDEVDREYNKGYIHKIYDFSCFPTIIEAEGENG